MLCNFLKSRLYSKVELQTISLEKARFGFCVLFYFVINSITNSASTWKSTRRLWFE